MVASLGFAGAVTALMQTLVIPLLPELPARLGTSITATSWVASVTLVAGGVGTPVFGRMGDLYGKRRMMLWLLMVALIGSVIAAVAGSLAVLLVGRVLQGVGLGVLPLSFSILRDELPPERLGRGVAVVSGFMLALGSGFGPLLMGGILDVFGWRAVFWVAAAVTAVALVLVIYCVEESPVRAPVAFDWPGALGLSATIVLLLLAITRGGDWGWTSPAITLFIVGAAAIGGAWARWERRQEAPLVDFAVTFRGPVLITHLAGAMVGFATFAQYLAAFTLVALPRETGYGLGRSMLVAGMTQAPGAALMLGAAPMAARITRLWGSRRLLIVGSGVVTLGFAFGIVRNGALWHIAVSAAFIYLGVGLAYCALPLLVMANVPVTETAGANAVNNLSRVIGSVIGSALVSAILAASVQSIAGGRYSAHWAFVSIYALGAVAAAGMVGLGYVLPNSRVEPVAGAVVPRR